MEIVRGDFLEEADISAKSEPTLFELAEEEEGFWINTFRRHIGKNHHTLYWGQGGDSEFCLF